MHVCVVEFRDWSSVSLRNRAVCQPVLATGLSPSQLMTVILLGIYTCVYVLTHVEVYI